MTRVLFLAERVELPQGDPASHGSSAHVVSTLSALRASFDVLALGAVGAASLAAAASPFRRVVPGPLRGARHDVLQIRADQRFAERALREAQAFRPDVVYARGEYLVRAGSTVAGRLGVPLVLEVNGLFAQEARVLYRSLLEPLGARIERRERVRAALVVVESPGMADLLVADGVSPERIATVPNAVAPGRVRLEPRAARADRAVVGWMGHLMPWHADALGFLVGGAERIFAADRSVRFEIAGGGPGMDALSARVPAGFSFKGVLPYGDVPAWLEGVDIALVPDTPPHKLPVKMVEFGAAGLPLVAPRSASLDAQLEPGVEYQPFVRGDADSLREALLAVVHDLGLRSRLATALHAAVRDRFTWTATTPVLRGAIERALGAYGEGGIDPRAL